MEKSIIDLMKTGHKSEALKRMKEEKFSVVLLKSKGGYEIIEVLDYGFFIECDSLINGEMVEFQYVPIHDF
jgi:predicted mannosyl-3-phosphoglycerate phosphatase (HAD superfamily)